MKHLLSTISILISLLHSSVVKSDVTEYFNYNLGDSYKSVMTTINRTDLTNVLKKRKTYRLIDTRSHTKKVPCSIQMNRLVYIFHLKIKKS